MKTLMQALRSARKPGTLLLILCLLSIWGHPAWSETIVLDQGKRQLTVSISEQFPEQTRDQLNQWIKHLSHSLTLVYGHWPRDRWAIEIEPVSGSLDDPIPWAQVHREDIDRVAFYVVSNTTAQTLKREWTGYHELSHLLLPYRGWGDTWFSEGLATYYQNILQARAGVISETQMWQKLHDGFERGKADDRFHGQTLLQVNQKMRENGGYMRVYWSGAWYFLAADIRLRELSDGAQSLDNALEQLNRCCARGSLSVAAIIAQMDRGNDQDVFAQLYQQVHRSRQMPSFEPLFTHLGISVVNGVVELQQQGDAALRRRQFLNSTAM
ncbi:MAG: hypothetical protein V7720_17075 [Halioglobus sp.]